MKKRVKEEYLRITYSTPDGQFLQELNIPSDKMMEAEAPKRKRKRRRNRTK